MKILKCKINLLVFILLISLFVFSYKVNAQTFDVYTVKANSCKVRTSPSDQVSAIKNGNDDVKVYKDMELDYIKTVYGPNNGKSNQEWYAVKFDYAAREYTGYVAKACMYDKKSYSYSDDSSFESSINSFPESYKPYLRKLHAIYPKWTFTADYTNLNWEEASEAESQKGTSAISYLYPSLIFKDGLNPNGIVVDGTSWYAPCKDAVKYYMDARNFINSKNIFMFKNLSYNESENPTVSEIFKGSFMDSSFSDGGRTLSYADAFIEAARENNISSVFLASRALQELGTSKPKQVTGTVSGYEGYYNFYNIGAYSGSDNYLKGLEYAKNSGWNGILKSIKGGASEIASKYINAGQNTTYFQKYNVASYHKRNVYTHQYQTNIMAPKTESEIAYKSYKEKNKLGYSYNFIIPVFNNRPDSAFKVSKTNTVGGSTIPAVKDNNQTGSGTNTGSNNNTNNSNKEIVISPETKLLSAGYNLSTGYLTKLTYSTNVSNIINSLKNQNANVTYKNNNGSVKTNGKVSTGDSITVDNKTYKIVIYGDISGDGTINIKDLLFVQRYILKSLNLTNENKVAADVNKDGNVTIKDLLIIQKHILGYSNVSQ